MHSELWSSQKGGEVVPCREDSVTWEEDQIYFTVLQLDELHTLQQPMNSSGEITHHQSLRKTQKIPMQHLLFSKSDTSLLFFRTCQAKVTSLRKVC